MHASGLTELLASSNSKAFVPRDTKPGLSETQGREAEALRRGGS